jgi:predicted RNA binding protein YcfA (HicA-like mRNA interferase family)
MSQFDKLVERLKRRPSEADPDDLCKLLRAHGWRERPGKKHTAIFTKPGVAHRQVIPTVSGRKVKGYVVDQVLQLLGLDD